MACLVYWMWINTSTANQPYVLKRNSTSTERLGTGLNQHTEGLEAVACLLGEVAKPDPVCSYPSSHAPFLCPVLIQGLW